MTSLGPCANNTLPISSLPPIRYIEQRDPELIALQQRTHLPRIPRATNACPQPLTLEQLIDWKSLWARKHRPSTQSERDDHSECDRQINNVASDSNHDLEVYDSEEERNQARREAHQRPLSPPSTPPHLKGPKLYKNRGLSVAPQTGSSKVKKAKSKSRVAPRRPYTRSREAPAVSLHHRKGQLVYWRLPWQYTVMGFDEYLRDFDREELHKQPWEPLDFSAEHPRFPRKTPNQLPEVDSTEDHNGSHWRDGSVKRLQGPYMNGNTTSS